MYFDQVSINVLSLKWSYKVKLWKQTKIIKNGLVVFAWIAYKKGLIFYIYVEIYTVSRLKFYKCWYTCLFFCLSSIICYHNVDILVWFHIAQFLKNLTSGCRVSAPGTGSIKSDISDNSVKNSKNDI